MNAIEEAFSFQIKSGTPCDGNYLGDKTLDERIKSAALEEKTVGHHMSDDEM